MERDHEAIHALAQGMHVLLRVILVHCSANVCFMVMGQGFRSKREPVG